jgi:lipopolysaccharide export system permease protein
MKIISTYIIRNHIAPFLFGTFTVTFLFLFQFILKYIDSLVGKGLDFWVIIHLIVLQLSWMIVLAVPMGVLFSTLMAFGGMAAALEITVIKSSGGSLYRMMWPMIVLGFLMTVALYWFNDNVLPESNHQAKILMNDIQKTKPTFAIEPGQFTSQIEGYTILAREVDSSSGILKGVTVYDNTNKVKSTIANADTGYIEFNHDFSKLIMTMYNGEIHQMMPFEPNNYRKVNFKTYQVLMNVSGFAFEKTSADMISRGDREMRIKDMQKIVDEADSNVNSSNLRIQNQLTQLNDYMKNYSSSKDSMVEQSSVKEDSSRMTALKAVDKRLSFFKSAISSDLYQKHDFETKIKQYSVEIWKKYSIPFACLVFVLIGCPLGIITKGGNFGFSAGISLLFYIFYWGCLIGGEKLADRAFISPFLSMWIGNIIIGLIGILLTIKINNETMGFSGKKLFGRFLKFLPV